LRQKPSTVVKQFTFRSPADDYPAGFFVPGPKTLGGIISNPNNQGDLNHGFTVFGTFTAAAGTTASTRR
jgi:hypothetical protein